MQPSIDTVSFSDVPCPMESGSAATWMSGEADALLTPSLHLGSIANGETPLTWLSAYVKSPKDEAIVNLDTKQLFSTERATGDTGLMDSSSHASTPYLHGWKGDIWGPSKACPISFQKVYFYATRRNPYATTVSVDTGDGPVSSGVITNDFETKEYFTYFPVGRPIAVGNPGSEFIDRDSEEDGSVGLEWRGPIQSGAKGLDMHQVAFADRLTIGGQPLPFGVIMAWDADNGSIPAGWVECDGRGIVNGITVPDYRGRFLAGVGRAPDLPAYAEVTSAGGGYARHGTSENNHEDHRIMPVIKTAYEEVTCYEGSGSSITVNSIIPWASCGGNWTVESWCGGSIADVPDADGDIGHSDVDNRPPYAGIFWIIYVGT